MGHNITYRTVRNVGTRWECSCGEVGIYVWYPDAAESNAAIHIRDSRR